MGKARVRSDVGKVATPPSVALHMVAKLFNHTTPPPESRVLDAGCGSGVFVEAIIAYLRRRGAEIPEIVCIDNDFNLVNMARRRFEDLDRVKVVYGDFLAVSERELGGGFDYIISNPPYVSYEAIDPKSRDLYRRVFKVARGRFDIYMLFFEKALTLLKPKGRMVFITPEKYLYVLSASSLRRLLARHAVEEIELLDERVFGALAYPAITVVRKEPLTEPTTFRLRDGSIVKVTLPSDGRSWLQVVEEARLSIRQPARCYKLERLALRISAGVATGRDEVYVVPRSTLPKELEPYAYPTVSGRDLSMFKPGAVIDYGRLEYVMLIPYDRNGRLLGESEAKTLIDYLSKYRQVLEERVSVKRKGKKWYALHEDPPLTYILRPKILWRDIALEPSFYVDERGEIVPRHTVYYLVPKDPNMVYVLAEYLNSSEVREQLKHRCQRAANNYIRLQSHIIKELCIPEDMVPSKTRTELTGRPQV